MRRGDARLGAEIRWNRKLAGLMQDGLGREFGISPKTVGKWERGGAFPSPRNIRALRRVGPLDPGSDGGAGGQEKGKHTVSLVPIGRSTAQLGVDAFEALSRIEAPRDGSGRALAALFRALLVEQREAVLEIAGAMQPAAAGIAKEEEAERGR